MGNASYLFYGIPGTNGSPGQCYSLFWLLNNRRFWISMKITQIKEPSVLVFFWKNMGAWEDWGVLVISKTTKELAVFRKELLVKKAFFFLGQFFSEPRFYVKTSFLIFFSGRINSKGGGGREELKSEEESSHKDKQKKKKKPQAQTQKP